MPLTARDAFYANPFPSYDEVADHILSLPGGMTWWSELGLANYQRLMRIFDSRSNEEVIRAAGVEIEEAGGVTAMQAMYYTYHHMVAQRCYKLDFTFNQAVEFIEKEVRVISRLWDGIGGWMH